MKRNLLVLIGLCSMSSANCQHCTDRVISIDELFRLTDSNSRQLQVAAKEIAINVEKARTARIERLPEIETAADAGYLSDLTILRPDLSYLQTTHAPHFTNNYFLQAAQLVFKGGYVKSNIEKSELLAMLSALDRQKQGQDLRILLLGKYFDLLELLNAEQIYEKNIVLAERRLKDVQSLRSQGMVTRNDVIRSELQIEDFRLDLEDIVNHFEIVNRELTVTLSLPDTLRIIPDTAIYGRDWSQTSPEEAYLQVAYVKRPSMQQTRLREAIARKNVQLERSKQWPALSVYAGDALQRPFLYSLTPVDIYFNAFQAGISLRYDISSLYRVKSRITEEKIGYDEETIKSDWQRQQIEIEVHTAFTNYREANERYITLRKSLEYANENYRIVERKYLNQLALITDMLDASTAKLSAELRLSNGRIDIINRWYQLQKASGNF